MVLRLCSIFFLFSSVNVKLFKHHSFISFKIKEHSSKLFSFFNNSRNCLYNSVFFISFIHSLKKFTVRTIPFGTFKFNEFNFINEYPFPPTSDI
ncbi:hypothetical protein BCR36DRAFT_22762 [Piromyces finnis]|uniref:Secreted protein n=1 Tax=Piromyces finnis TaxID=1754191 RepID=A0A1Y1UL15_9FUNG|nr:hypothetical protein BCR36DRAFT_22762 [Piromyces finnis]|eukprot:ORX38748.1 hypothetical protein BCR36DRAFT_22762 [Piromyces finnis]